MSDELFLPSFYMQTKKERREYYAIKARFCPLHVVTAVELDDSMQIPSDPGVEEPDQEAWRDCKMKSMEKKMQKITSPITSNKSITNAQSPATPIPITNRQQPQINPHMHALKNHNLI